MDTPRTVVVGLDGASFELIEPWLESGHLPNIARIVDDGVQGTLESVLPPVTSPNWKTYATGKNPGKLGIFWWENVDVTNRRVGYPDERKHAHATFWELLAEDDPVCVIGVPTTYPPTALNGAVVAGAPDGANEGYTHPPELETELEERFDYRVTKRYRLKDDVERAAEEIHELIERRFDAAEYLCAEYDPQFLQVTTFYLNSLHHYLWDHEYTLAAWQIVDDYLGTVLSDERDVVLMSDHGSNQIETVFNVNTWLERERYLQVDAGVSEIAYRLGLHTDRLVRIATALGVQETAERRAPDWLLDRLPDESGALKRSSKATSVDWDESKALASGQGPLYVLDRATDVARTSLVDELRRALAGLEHEGRAILESAHPADAVYEGPYVPDGPDLLLDQAPGVHISGAIGGDAVFEAPAQSGWVAENKRHGLFAALGPSFGDGTVEGLSILDLAPTLLHLHGRAIPADMDGRVASEVFEPGTAARQRDVAHAPVSKRKREIRRIQQVARRLESGELVYSR